MFAPDVAAIESIRRHITTTRAAGSAEPTTTDAVRYALHTTAAMIDKEMAPTRDMEIATAVQAISKPDYNLDLSGIDFERLSRLYKDAVWRNARIEF